MSRFFDSEEVRKSLFELDNLQETILNELMTIPFYGEVEKREHLDLMRTFLEKQKLFIFRMSLSDDPEAVELKEQIISSAKMFGMDEGETIQDFFNKMEQSLDELEKSLDS